MIIEGNGKVFAKDKLGDGMQLWGLRGHTIVQNGTIENCQTGFDIRDCTGVLEFINVTVKAGPNNFIKPNDTTQKWSRAFLIGYPGLRDTANGLVILKNCSIESLGAPSGNYSKFNRDNIQLEENLPDLPVHLRVEDSYLGGATDSCCDLKGRADRPSVSIFNRVVFGPAHRALRVWDNASAYHTSCTWLRGSNEEIWKQNTGVKVVDLLA